MLSLYHFGRQRIKDNKKCRWIAGSFDCYADVAVRCGVHRPIEHVQGILKSCIRSYIGAPAQELTPFFFFGKFWQDSSLAELRKSGWWYGKIVHKKSHLADFWYHAPSTPILITAEIVKTRGGFPNLPTMELLNSAMLEHHKFPGWCSNIACFFLVHLPAEISDAQS